MNNIEILTLNQKNITDFAEARNRLLKTAASSWVFFVDTDEVVSDGLKKEIKDLDPKGYYGFYIKRKIIFLGKEIGEDKVLRLAKKDAGRWERKIHEAWKVKGKVGTLKNYIIHNTASDLHSYIEKMNNYSDIHARENLKEGKKVNLFRMIFYPKAKFIQNVLAGRGFVFSMLMSFHSFLGWAKQWELQKE
jgi:hypothetical protein